MNKGNLRQDLYRQLGKRIRTAREEAGLTQTELASAISLSRTSVTNIESGRQQILLHSLYDMALVLGKNVIDLLPETEQEGSEGSVNSSLADLNESERQWVKSVLSKTKMGR